MDFTKNFDYKWNKEKEALLNATRNISFVDILAEMIAGRIIDIINHPSKNFLEQRGFVLNLDSYAYVVPFVISGKEIFLKTAFPSRRATELYNIGTHYER